MMRRRSGGKRLVYVALVIDRIPNLVIREAVVVLEQRKPFGPSSEVGNRLRRYAAVADDGLSRETFGINFDVFARVPDGDPAPTLKRRSDLLQVHESARRDLMPWVVQRVDQRPVTLTNYDQLALVFQGNRRERPESVSLAQPLDHLTNLARLSALLNEIAGKDGLTSIGVRVDAWSCRDGRDDSVARPRADAPGRDSGESGDF